jgi:hypothetical protein
LQALFWSNPQTSGYYADLADTQSLHSIQVGLKDKSKIPLTERQLELSNKNHMEIIASLLLPPYHIFGHCSLQDLPLTTNV